jgi:hypothetical protein
MVGAVEQNQQVDVRVGVQFAATIAADRQQGDIGVIAPGQTVPGFTQDLIGEPGTILDQSADIATGLEACVEHLMGAANGFLEGADGAGLQGQFGLELAAVEQFGVYLRHAAAFFNRARTGQWRRWAGQAEVRGMLSSLRRVKIS